MLFNSYAFLFAFLPVALVAYFGLAKLSAGRLAVPVIVAASLAFYTYWDWHNLFVLVPSLLGNFVLGRALTDTHDAAHPRYTERMLRRRPLLIAAVALNLLLLGAFKYTDFAIDTVNSVSGVGLPLQHIVLPLGISFFTFEQIAYVVDSARGQSRRYGFFEYCYFVTFFPHLIAGPIIQHNELLAQIEGDNARTVAVPQAENLAVGIAIFVVGLFKKVVIADACATVVGPLYDQMAPGSVPTFVAAWTATVGYSLQLYFDFSGYSDMAIGLARLFNVKLPQNFNSPYKAHNPIEFWRRWHMTLSRFLRNYLYIPLGGNRGSEGRRYFNNFLTMLLGGLWHGAGWGFVAWGALNGIYLAINNVLRKLRNAPKDNAPEGPWWLVELACLWTFFLIMVSRVFFRAPSLTTTKALFLGLFGGGGLGADAFQPSTVVGFLLLYVFCRHAPNTQQVFAAYAPVVGRVDAVRGRLARVRFALTPAMAVAVGMLALVAVLRLTRVSTFLYFQF